MKHIISVGFKAFVLVLLFGVFGIVLGGVDVYGLVPINGVNITPAAGTVQNPNDLTPSSSLEGIIYRNTLAPVSVNLTLEVLGGAPFRVYPPTMSLVTGGTTTLPFTIEPLNDLQAGTHPGIIRISDGDSVSHYFYVSYTVRPTVRFYPRNYVFCRRTSTGDIGSGSSVDFGSELVFRAYPRANHTFSHWTMNDGTPLNPDSLPYGIFITADEPSGGSTLSVNTLNQNHLRNGREIEIIAHYTPIQPGGTPRRTVIVRNVCGNPSPPASDPVCRCELGFRVSQQFPTSDSDFYVNQRVSINPGYKPGHTFVRWVLSGGSDAQLALVPGIAPNTLIMPSNASGDIILTAIWLQDDTPPDQHTVRIRNNPLTVGVTGQVVEPGNNPSRVHTMGDTVYVNAGVKPGYTFNGWTSPAYVSLVNITESRARFTMPDRPVVITANWVRNQPNLVTIENNPCILPRTPARQTPSNESHQEGARVSLYAGTKTGFEFVRWRISVAPPFVAPNVNGEFNSSASFIMPNGNVTVTAIWTPAASRLIAPTNLHLNAAGTRLQWDDTNSPSAQLYRIYLNGQPTNQYVNTRTFDLARLNLRDDGTHNIQVRALSMGLSNVTDSALSVTYTLSRNQLPAPTNVRLQPNSTILTWSAVNGAYGYHIYVNGHRRTTDPIVVPPSTRTFDIATLNLPAGETHNITVRAIRQDGTTATNSEQSIAIQYSRDIPVIPRLAAPTSINITGNPHVSWVSTNAGRATHYRVYVNGQGSMGITTSSPFNLANLALPAGNYLIQVRAIGDGVNFLDSEISAFRNHTVPDDILPALATPQNPRVTGTTFTWNTVPNATGYRIYVNGEPSTSGVIGGTTFDLNTLNLGAGTHLIQVRAIGDGQRHADSAVSAFATYVIGGSNSGYFTVNFAPNGGVMPTGISTSQLHSVGSTINTLPNPTRSGYVFTGWVLGNNVANPPLIVNGDMTLRAMWLPTNAVPVQAHTGANLQAAQQFLVEFDPGMGILPANEDGLRLGPRGFSVNNMANPTRSGYTFTGWQADGQPVSLPLTVSDNMVIQAMWTPTDSGSINPTSGTTIPTRPNPQTGMFTLFNFMAVLVITGLSAFVVMRFKYTRNKETINTDSDV